MIESNYALVLIALHAVLAVLSAGHALLYKRDPRASLGWIAVCLAYPLVGPMLYFIFGINRIRSHAHSLKGASSKRLKISQERPEAIRRGQAQVLPPRLTEYPELAIMAAPSAAVTHRPLVDNNSIQPFFDGESAYAAMLYAIANAQHSISLASYLFATDSTGSKFIAALSAAEQRGVEVRVLLDGIGELYNFPRAGHLLKKYGVRIARFLPPRLLPPSIHINLRNHRKMLIVDSHIAFTGGMNIGDRQLRKQPNRKETTDIHFQLTGPVIDQLQQVFDEDWTFVTKALRPPPSEATSGSGNTICRVITDGPDEDLDKLTMIMTSAVALARKRVSIMTPYFLPPATLINALQGAALRGVEVSVILPQCSNQPPVHWATRNMLWELLQFGVHVYYRPPPFAHSKLLLIDDAYAHIGSANLDPRSLRLNFEIVVEVFDQDFVLAMRRHFEQVQSTASEETLVGVDGRSLPIRIRDAFAWLFSPYL